MYSIQPWDIQTPLTWLIDWLTRRTPNHCEVTHSIDWLIDWLTRCTPNDCQLTQLIDWLINYPKCLSHHKDYRKNEKNEKWVHTMAKPTSAFFKAGPSFVPSPVTATTSRLDPIVLSMIPLTRMYLSCGEDRARTRRVGQTLSINACRTYKIFLKKIKTGNKNNR